MKYLLETSCDNSRTWSAHIKHLSRKYELEDPLVCLSKDPPSKSVYKEHILTKITAYYEKTLRLSATGNSQMNYFNVATTGLRSRLHPAVCNIITSQEVKLSRPHIKFLSGNYLTYKTKAEQSGGLTHCRICLSGCDESISHVISTCQAMAVEREKLLVELKDMCCKTKNQINFTELSTNEETLCQFILDPTSLNLPVRVSLSDPLMPDFYKFCRNYCFKLDKTRCGLLAELEKKRKQA